MASDAEHFFMSMGPLYVLLGEVSTQVHCPFFNWIVCLPGVELYEFFIYFGDYTLCLRYHWQICSLITVGSLFILMMVYLVIQIFSLM